MGMFFSASLALGFVLLSGCAAVSHSPSFPDANPSIVDCSQGNTIRQCLATLPAAGGTVKLAAAAYVPGTSTCIPASNISLIGEHTPTFTPDHTALTGGSIIHGAMRFCGNGVTLRNLGIDVGPAWVAAGNEEDEGLDIDGPTGSPTDPVLHNIDVENLIVLESSPGAQVHGILIEHADQVTVRNIQTMFGVHGVALKSTNVLADGISSAGNTSDCLAIKGDAYTSISNVPVSHLTCSASSPGDTGAAIAVESTGTTGRVAHVQLTDVSASGLYVGIMLSNTSLAGRGALSDVSIAGLTVTETNLPANTPTCLMTGGTAEIEDVAVSDVDCENKSSQAAAPLSGYMSMVNSRITNWHSGNGGYASYLTGTLNINGWTDNGDPTQQPTFDIVGAGTTVNLSGYSSTRGNPAYAAYDGAVVNFQ